MSHIHAQAMMEYAKDALETDTPWERWEYSQNGRYFMSMGSHPTWYDEIKYRRKQKVILINGYEVPEPQRARLADGEVYWTFTFADGVIALRWLSDEDDINYLKNGVVHLSQKAAEKHFEAITSFTMKK